MWLVFKLLALGLLISGPEKLEATSNTEKEPSSLQFLVSTDEQNYIPGHPIRLILTLTNLSNTDLILSFPSSHQYDFLVKRGTEEIWRWSHGRMFAEALTELVLAPHKTHTIHATWNQRDQNGKQIPPGSYEVIGLLLTTEKTYTDTTPFHIGKLSPSGLTK